MNQTQNFSNQEYRKQSQYYKYYNEHKIALADKMVTQDYRRKEYKENTAKVFKIIIIFLIFVIFLQILYHLYFAGNLVISKVEVEIDDSLSLSDDMILDMAGLESEKSYFAVDTLSIKKRLELYPNIFHATVEKEFPDTVKIALKGRNPLAICLVETQNGTIPLVVDSQGVVFQIGKNVNTIDLPVISGVKFNEVIIGAVMPQAIIDFLQCIDKLRDESPIYFNSISECKIIRKSNDDFDVLVYPDGYNTPVKIGRVLSKEKLTYILLVLDALKKQGVEQSFKELDFRTDKVIYKVRG